MSLGFLHSNRLVWCMPHRIQLPTHMLHLPPCVSTPLSRNCGTAWPRAVVKTARWHVGEVVVVGERGRVMPWKGRFC